MLLQDYLSVDSIVLLDSARLAMSIARYSLQFTRLKVIESAAPACIVDHLVYDDSQNKWHFETEVKPDWGQFFRKYRTAGLIPDDLGIQFACALSQECVWDYHCLFLKKVYQKEQHIFNQPIIDVITSYLTNKDINEPFDDEAFLRIYTKYYSKWLASTQRDIVIVPLSNFMSSLDLIDIEDEIKIIKLTREKVIDLWERHESRDRSDFSPILQASHCIWAEFINSVEDEQKYKKVLEVLFEKSVDIITSLRLTSEGSVGTPGIIHLTDSISISTQSFTTHLGIHDERSRDSANPCNFTIDNVNNFTKIYCQIQKIRKTNSFNNIDICLNRFNLAFNRDLIEDAIIDLTIALESSLLFGTKDELKYRLMIRGASLLSKKRSPIETYEILKLFYDARSNIVHNGQSLHSMRSKDLKNKQPIEFLRMNRRLVAEILTEYISMLESGTSMDKIQTYIDSKVINSLDKI